MAVQRRGLMGTFEDLDCQGPYFLLWGQGAAGQPRFCCSGKPSVSSAFPSLVNLGFFLLDASGDFYVLGGTG